MFGWPATTDMTNLAPIRAGTIFKYNESVNSYVDHVEPPRPPAASAKVKRVRSYSTNSKHNGCCMQADYPAFIKTSQIAFPGPSGNINVFDENEWEIGDSEWVMDVGTATSGATPTKTPVTWRDIPSARHGNGAVMGFADGHSELWKWVGPEVSQYTIADQTTMAGRSFPAGNWTPPVKGYLDPDLMKMARAILDRPAADAAAGR